jgi:ANTAR domain-containing protein/PAS domain-containing protein
VGQFRFFFADERWEWSEVVQQMHGYAPGMVTPTTELVLSHKHPEDRDRIAITIDKVRRTGEPFSTHHRIIDVAGDEHDVVVVASQLRDERGVVIGSEGFYVDVTPSVEVLQEEISAEVAKFAENRAIIEQAKGMLMNIYGIDAAFELLKWRSQETNIKLRLVAEQITRDFVALTRQHHRIPTRAEYDNLLLSAHERITNDASADTPQGPID